MSQENVDLVTGGYDDFNSGNYLHVSCDIARAVSRD